MNQRQTHKYQCLTSCQATASQYQPDWLGYAPFVDPWNRVLAKKVILDGLIANQTNPFTAAGNKAILRLNLKTDIIRAVTALEWLAGSTHDATLLKLAHLTPSDIDEASEPALVGLATKRHGLIHDHLGALGPVEYLPADATIFQANITAFSNALGSPGAEHDTHQLVTTQIETVLNDIFKILSEECDPAVAARGINHPDFAAQWHISREIGESPARRTRALEVHVDDSVSKAPLPDASATFSNGPEGIKDKRTAEGGSFYVQSMEPGEYTMQVSRPGYAPVITRVIIVTGQKTVLTVLLTKQL